MKKKSLSLTVGIPTYYGGPSLVKTVKSILSSKGVGKFRLIVSVDGNPLQKNIHKQLKDLGVEVVNNKERGGQVARIKQIISLTNSDLIILTQDDVLFEKYTLKELVKGFKNNLNITMESGRMIPLKPTNLFEKTVHVGVSASYTIGKKLHTADNYYLAAGRCLAFKSEIAKKFEIPDELLNSDTYLYFLNKKMGGEFLHVPTAVYHIRSPKTLPEHMKQSKKYQQVPKEMKHYLRVDINQIQPTPLKLKLYALFKELVRNPILTILYLGIMFYTRTQKKDMYENVERFWETDASTKEL